jgi:hypothetical protein
MAMKQIVAIAIALALSACTGSMTMERSPDYELGFADGCGNAASQGPGVLRDPKRSEMLYASNEDYRQGWNSGNVQCRPQLPNHL